MRNCGSAGVPARVRTRAGTATEQSNRSPLPKVGAPAAMPSWVNCHLTANTHSELRSGPHKLALEFVGGTSELDNFVTIHYGRFLGRIAPKRTLKKMASNSDVGPGGVGQRVPHRNPLVSFSAPRVQLPRVRHGQLGPPSGPARTQTFGGEGAQIWFAQRPQVTASSRSRAPPGRRWRG